MAFVKGQSGNPSGLPKGKKHHYSYKRFEEAIKQVEKDKQKEFFVHVIERAYKSDKVLVAVLKKLIPDMPPTSGLPDEEWVKQQIDFLSAIFKPNGEKDKFQRFYN